MNNLSRIIQKYDIRGKYPQEINEKIIFYLGRVFKKIFKNKKIFLAWDARESSFSLANAFLKGYGKNQTKPLGMVPITAFYWWCQKQKTNGIFITASHLKKGYNGIKIFLKSGESFNPAEIKKISVSEVSYSFFEDKVLIKNFINRELFENYLIFLRKKCPLKNSHSFILDSGNGIMSLFLGSFKKIFPNLTFLPVHYSPEGLLLNPLKDNQVIKKLTKEKKQLGVMFDGDGDRVLFFENGKIILPDYLLLLLSHHFKFKKIVAPVYLSTIVIKNLKKSKVKIYFSPTGHRFFKAKMKKTSAQLGVEVSGHFYFKIPGKESPLLALLMILKILEMNPSSSLEKLINQYQPRKLIRFDSKKKLTNLIEIIKNQLNYDTIKKVDGLKFEGKNFFVHLRKSETEDLVRISIEAENQKLLNQLIKILK